MDGFAIARLDDGRWQARAGDEILGHSARRDGAVALVATAAADVLTAAGETGAGCTLTFVEGEQSVDRRILDPDSVNFDREPPLPLMLLTETSFGHDGARLAGAITSLTRHGTTILATGHFDTSEVGVEAQRLVGDGMLNTWSPDIGDATVDFECTALDDEGFCTDGVEHLLSGTLLGGTIVPFPALDSARITLAAAGEPEAVTAAVDAPVAPPVEWFCDPALEALTPLTTTDDGRIFGHIAPWDTCHVGIGDACVTAPHSATGYAHFATGEIRCEDGCSIPVGVLTVGGGHADRYAGAQAAVEHYDEVGAAVADVAIGEDAYGIWVAGALRPGVTDEQLRVLRASPPSGDWRRIGGSLELVAICAVNVPGFPVPRLVTAGGQPQTLIAAGAARMAALGTPPDPIALRIDALEHEVAVLRAALAPLSTDAFDRIVAGIVPAL